MFTEGCVIIDNISVPKEVAAVLGVSSIEDAVRHVIIFREHVRDLRLLGAYSNGRVTVTKAMIKAVRDQVKSLIFNASAKTP